MNRENMVDDINLMIVDMQSEMVAVKVKPDHLSIPAEAKAFSKELVTEGYHWLAGIYNKEFAAVRTVRNLLTTDQWNRYQLWDSFKYTQEMKLLREKQKPFRKAITSKDRPALFKKGVQNEQIKAISTEKR